jgi:hypothetical protein
MPRRFRRYARTARTVRPVRYSNETVSGTCGGAIQAGTTVHQPLLKPIDAQDIRKLKNPTLRLAMTAPTPNFPVLWALVYVPEGFPLSALKMDYGTGGEEAPPSLFEPNQNLIMSGVMPATGTAEPITYRSRLARNLNAGDSIFLLLRGISGETSIDQVAFVYCLNFAICYA